MRCIGRVVWEDGNSRDRENDKRENPTAYEEYPNPKASDVTLYLSPGAPKAGNLSTIESKNQGTEKLVDNYSFAGNALARAEYTNHRLMYVTPTLKKDIHISIVR